MARRNKFNFWHAFTGSGLRRLALAVGLIFSVLGPLQTLMLPIIPPHFWFRLLLLTVGSGGLAASIILMGNRPFRMIISILLFTSFIFVVGIAEQRIFGESSKSASENAVSLTEKDVAQQKKYRVFMSLLGMFLVATGYASFISFITKEGEKRVRFETEVNIARQIQKSLLPQEALNKDWCQISGKTVPATEVGGDYFDIFSLSKNKIALVIADVSGHGTGAGIMAAMTKSALLATITDDKTPSQILNHVNNLIYKVSQKQIFVTMAFLLLERENSRITTVTAGHPPLLFYRNEEKTISEIRTPALALGLQPDVEFEEKITQFKKGDALLLYTDGFLESTDKQDQPFEIERLKTSFGSHLSKPTTHFCEAVLSDLRSFTGKPEFHDDATIVLARL